MKNTLRLLSLVLALLLTLSVFVSCNGSNTEDESLTKAPDKEQNAESDQNTTEAGTEEFKPDIEENNYGKDYFLHIHGDVNPAKYYWVKESENDTLSQALYARQQTVQDYLGVEIIGTNTQPEGKYVEPFKNAVMNKDGSIHTILTHNYLGINSLISGNFFADLKNVPSLNLDSEYWNQDFMSSISLKDRYYLGFSNFNILYTNVISFNKDMLDKYGDVMEESIYSMVTNYRWTLDQMISLANLVYIDQTGDGKTIDDTFGFSGMLAVPFVNFLQASDINLVEQNEKGDYVVVVYNEINKAKTTTLVDKLKGLTESDCAWTYAFGSSTKVELATGRTLMDLTPSINLPSLLNYDINFGVVPYPMFDENQKDVGYRSLQWGGYIAIPSYVDDLDMTSETLELLSFYSDDVNLAFYEKLLGKQVADSVEDKKMLEIVWDGVCSDFGQTYHSVISKTDLLYIVARLAPPGTTKSIGSFMASVDKSANKLINKFLQEVE